MHRNRRGSKFFAPIPPPIAGLRIVDLQRTAKQSRFGALKALMAVQSAGET